MSVRADLLRQLEAAEKADVEVELTFSGELDVGDPPGHHFARGVPAVGDDGFVQLAADGRESWWYPVLKRLDGDPPSIIAVKLVEDTEAPERLTLLSDGDLDELIRVETAKLAAPNERARQALERMRVEQLYERGSEPPLPLVVDPDAQDELEQALKIAEVAMLFGQVLRTTEHPDGQPESDTTHTVMLGLLAIELAPTELRRAQLLGAVLIHDLVETYAKDTCTAWGLTLDERDLKSAREQAALERLRALGIPRIVELIEDYERQATPEARWVRYIDKICPRLTHLLNRGSALRSIGMTRADMLAKHEEQAVELAEMYPEQVHARALYVAATKRCEAELALADSSAMPGAKSRVFSRSEFGVTGSQVIPGVTLFASTGEQITLTLDELDELVRSRFKQPLRDTEDDDELARGVEAKR